MLCLSLVYNFPLFCAVLHFIQCIAKPSSFLCNVLQGTEVYFTVLQHNANFAAGIEEKILPAEPTDFHIKHIKLSILIVSFIVLVRLIWQSYYHPILDTRISVCPPWFVKLLDFLRFVLF